MHRYETPRLDGGAGSAIAYTSDQGGMFDIWLYWTLTGFGSTIFQEGASDAQWFPSGMALLFAAPDSAGNTQLYRINADGTNKRPLTRNSEGPHHIA